MCVGEKDSAAFIRRRLAAINFLQRLLDEGLLNEEAIEATTDKFGLNSNIREDYRIYKALWKLMGD